MSIMYITEYERLAVDDKGNTVQVGLEPAIARQFITLSATSAPSASFNPETNFVRIQCDLAAHIVFAAAPVAVAGEDTPVTADVGEYFGVGAGLSVAGVLA